MNFSFCFELCEMLVDGESHLLESSISNFWYDPYSSGLKEEDELIEVLQADVGETSVDVFSKKVNVNLCPIARM